jgi:hypothetical protein
MQSSLKFSALDKPDHHYDHRYHQQNVNESAHAVGRYQPQRPENDQNNRNGFQHDFVISLQTGEPGILILPQMPLSLCAQTYLTGRLAHARKKFICAIVR